MGGYSPLKPPSTFSFLGEKMKRERILELLAKERLTKEERVSLAKQSADFDAVFDFFERLNIPKSEFTTKSMNWLLWFAFELGRFDTKSNAATIAFNKISEEKQSQIKSLVTALLIA